MAARPRTLPAAIAPVLVGTAAAIEQHGDLRRVWALHRRADRQRSSSRSGPTSPTTTRTQSAAPTRSTGSGRCASPRRAWSPRSGSWSRPGSRSASPSLAGIYLATVAGWVIIAVGVASIAAGVLYTGGPRPYGYAGLGEFFVFLFFGLVAVNGSYYVQLERLDWLPFGLSVAVGLPGDGDPGGQQRARHRDRPPRRQADARRAARAASGARASTSGLVVAAYVGAARHRRPAAGARGGRCSACSSAPLAMKPARAVMTRTDGPALNGALAGTGALLGVFSLLVSLGLLLAS